MATPSVKNTGPSGAPRLQGLSANLCLAMSKLFLTGPLRPFGFRKAEITRFDSMENYVADRVEQINDYLHLFRPFASFEGKTVLELGCNQGYLLNSFLQRESFDAIGADIDQEALQIAQATYGGRIRFVHTTPTTIPMPDESVDVVYTIDTVEHLACPREMFVDCVRILRPGGLLLAHFHAWLGPYGSHLEDTIPFPWANVVFSMDTLLRVAAHLYDSPEYSTACYYLDPNTGVRKPNPPYLDRAKWDAFLNRIRIGEFRKIIRQLPFEILHMENIGFSGKSFPLARYLTKLSQLPIAEELFTKATFAVLKKRS